MANGITFSNSPETSAKLAALALVMGGKAALSVSPGFNSTTASAAPKASNDKKLEAL